MHLDLRRQPPRNSRIRLSRLLQRNPMARLNTGLGQIPTILPHRVVQPIKARRAYGVVLRSNEEHGETQHASVSRFVGVDLVGSVVEIVRAGPGEAVAS